MRAFGLIPAFNRRRRKCVRRIRRGHQRRRGPVAGCRPDCGAPERQEPPDLYAQLGTMTFERYAVLGHARIGLQHVFKIRYFGAMVVTLHHRFGAVSGQWRVLESERV